ncbi:MAG: response regulator, partial [bacterium]
YYETVVAGIDKFLLHDDMVRKSFPPALVKEWDLIESELLKVKSAGAISQEEAARMYKIMKDFIDVKNELEGSPVLMIPKIEPASEPVLTTKKKELVKKDGEDRKDLSGLSILIVEDDYANKILASIKLKKAGADVYTAEGPEEALLVLNEHPIDIIYADMIMPTSLENKDSKQAGLFLARAIKKDDNIKEKPVFIVSSVGGGEALTQEMIDSGVDYYISKTELSSGNNLANSLLEYLNGSAPDISPAEADTQTTLKNIKQFGAEALASNILSTSFFDKYYDEIKNGTIEEKKKAYCVLSEIYSDIENVPSSISYLIEFKAAGAVLVKLKASIDAPAIVTSSAIMDHVDKILKGIVDKDGEIDQTTANILMNGDAYKYLMKDDARKTDALLLGVLLFKSQAAGKISIGYENMQLISSAFYSAGLISSPSGVDVYRTEEGAKTLLEGIKALELQNQKSILIDLLPKSPKM